MPRDDEVPPAPELKPKLPKLPSEKPSEGSDQYRKMGIAYTIPTALVAPIVGLTLLGVWADGRFRCAPWCAVGGALLGVVTGFINMIRLASRL